MNLPPRTYPGQPPRGQPQPIRSVIAARRLTIREAADAIGVSPNVLSAIVNGRRPPGVEAVYELCRVLDAAPKDLFTHDMLPDSGLIDLIAEAYPASE